MVIFLNTDKLSVRLATVAKYVLKEQDLQILVLTMPIYLVILAKNVGITFAIAGEVAIGPYQSAERNVLSEGLI